MAAQLLLGARGRPSVRTLLPCAGVCVCPCVCVRVCVCVCVCVCHFRLTLLPCAVRVRLCPPLPLRLHPLPHALPRLSGIKAVCVPKRPVNPAKEPSGPLNRDLQTWAYLTCACQKSSGKEPYDPQKRPANAHRRAPQVHWRSDGQSQAGQVRGRVKISMENLSERLLTFTQLPWGRPT